MEVEAVMRRSETHSYKKLFQSDPNKHMRSSENIAGMEHEKFLQNIGPYAWKKEAIWWTPSKIGDNS